MAETYLNQDRVKELWASIKTALAGKVDLAALDGYATPDTVATAIASALTDYPKNADVQTAVTTALADYMTAAEVNNAITSAVAAAAGIRFEAVNELPADEDAEMNVIYLIPNDGDAADVTLWKDHDKTEENGRAYGCG